MRGENTMNNFKRIELLLGSMFKDISIFNPPVDTDIIKWFGYTMDLDFLSGDGAPTRMKRIVINDISFITIITDKVKGEKIITSFIPGYDNSVGAAVILFPEETFGNVDVKDAQLVENITKQLLAASLFFVKHYRKSLRRIRTEDISMIFKIAPIVIVQSILVKMDYKLKKDSLSAYDNIVLKNFKDNILDEIICSIDMCNSCVDLLDYGLILSFRK